MRSFTLIATLVVAGTMVTSAARAQSVDSTSGPVLTLDEAYTLATHNNPDHLTVVETRRTAAAAHRAAYAAFLPRADAQLSGLYRQSGSQLVSGFSGFSSGSDVKQSSYFLGLTYDLSASTFINPRLEGANVNAAEADITSSASGLRSIIANDYFTVLADQQQAALQDSLIASNQAQLELARAKLAVGSGTTLDVTRAEVNLGTQQVAAIKAHNQVEVDKLKLFQDMGVPQPQNVQLTSRFTVQAPGFTLDSVLALARQQNPSLNAARSRDKAAALGVKTAKSGYLPTLQVQAGWSGFTNQYTDPSYPMGLAAGQIAGCLSQDSLRTRVGLPSLGCGTLNPDGTLPPNLAAQVRAENDQFPFDFSRQPFQVTAFISLPIFDRLQREQKVEEAEAQRNDARYKIRQQELKTTADVTAAYLTLTAAEKAVALQEENAKKAREELRLAQERYRVGASTFLDLTDARTAFERAEADRINAIYDYHKAFATLESAVGRPLR